jgi:hypothetical protein
VLRLLVPVRVVPSSPIVTLMKEAQVPPKRRFLQEPHGVTSQKTPFFIVTSVNTSNPTRIKLIEAFSTHGRLQIEPKLWYKILQDNRVCSIPNVVP